MRTNPRDGRAPSTGHPPVRSIKDPLLAVAVILLAIGALLGLAWAFAGDTPGRDRPSAVRRAMQLEWTPITAALQGSPHAGRPARLTSGDAAPAARTADPTSAQPAWLRAPDAIAAPWSIDPDGTVRWQR